MPSKVDSNKRQSALCMCCSQISATRNESYRSSRNWLRRRLLNDKPNARVVRHKELVALQWTGRKSLLSIPCHIVQRHECAVHQEQIVKETATDDDVVCLLDNARQGPEGRRWRAITLLIDAE